jgi:hypothetical protein
LAFIWPFIQFENLAFLFFLKPWFDCTFALISKQFTIPFQVFLFFCDFKNSWFLDNKMPVKDKHVLVIGSEVPWLEAVLLSKGAKKITTFDYATIESRHPQVQKINIRSNYLITKSRYNHDDLCSNLLYV